MEPFLMHNEKLSPSHGREKLYNVSVSLRSCISFGSWRNTSRVLCLWSCEFFDALFGRLSYVFLYWYLIFIAQSLFLKFKVHVRASLENRKKKNYLGTGVDPGVVRTLVLFSILFCASRVTLFFFVIFFNLDQLPIEKNLSLSTLTIHAILGLSFILSL